MAAIAILVNWLACLINHPADAKKNETSTPDDHAGQSKPMTRGDYHRSNEQETTQDLKSKSNLGSLFRRVVKFSFRMYVRCK